MRNSHRALRDGTRLEHERLDTLFGRFDLADAGDYADFLAAHAAVVLPLEAALDAGGVSEIVADWAERRRSGAITADLAALGRPVPAPVAVPPVATQADLIGAAYVVEGSRLGGRMLARQVADGLPVSYLAADQTPGNWGKLLARIDDLLYDEVELTQAIKTARAVFASFETSGRAWVAKEE